MVKFNPLARIIYAQTLPDLEDPMAHLDSDNVIPPTHSAFVITTTTGEELILHGTPEQFGRTNRVSINDKQEIEERFVDKKEGEDRFKYPDQERKRLAEVGYKGSEAKFWGGISTKLRELLGELNWDALKGHSDDGKETYVLVRLVASSTVLQIYEPIDRGGMTTMW